MKKLSFALLLLVTALSCSGVKKPLFEPYMVEGLEERPDFWKVRPQEIIDICSSVKIGKAEIIARTPLGYPVYAIFYGDFNEAPPQTNFSAGNSSSAIKAYLGETDHPQTVLFSGGVHGSEPESVVAALNMIQLLETGRDFRGKEDPEFLELAAQYRLIIAPCINMDGRSICPDHFRGQPYEVFRGCSQGWWKDGTLVGWKGSKEWFPLPLDKVSYPGGYPNSEGYNIMHDVTPGDIRTDEARGLLNLMSRWRVDFYLNGHSCEYQSFMCAVDYVDTPEHRERGNRICRLVNDALFEAGLQSHRTEGGKQDNTINLSNATNWCSGGLGMTLECSHSYDNIHEPKLFFTFEQLMEPPFIALKTILRDGLEIPLACRPETK